LKFEKKPVLFCDLFFLSVERISIFIFQILNPDKRGKAGKGLAGILFLYLKNGEFWKADGKGSGKGIFVHFLQEFTVKNGLKTGFEPFKKWNFSVNYGNEKWSLFLLKSRFPASANFCCEQSINNYEQTLNVVSN